MTRYVIDASVAVEYLLKTPVGLAVAALVERVTPMAPDLLDAEVLSVLRAPCWAGASKKGVQWRPSTT